MRIGTMFLGEVESLGGDSIQTKFFVLGMPLVPMASYYVTNDRGLAGVSGFEIPIHGKSVLLGYARIVFGIGAVLWAVLGHVSKSYSDGPEIYIGPAILAVAWAFSIFVFGRVPKGDRAQRLLLKATIGIAADPDVLPLTLRRDMMQRLEKMWSELSERAWRAAATAPELEHGIVLYALARYEGDAALARSLWQRILGDQGGGSGSPYR